MTAKTILIVDDDPAFARSLSVLLTSEGYRCCCSNDSAGALRVARSQPVDCALIDYNLGATLGTVLLGKFTEEGNNFPKIMLTGYGDVRAATAAMKMGAADFIEKRYQPSELLDAIAKAINTYTMARRSVDSFREARLKWRALTDRENEIVDAIAAGYSSRQIADALSVSPRTVEAHRANVLHKLGIGNTAALVRLAVLSGLCAPEV